MPEYVPILLSGAKRKDLLREVQSIVRFIGSLSVRNEAADAAALADIAARASVKSPKRVRLAMSVDSLDNLATSLGDLEQKELHGEWTLRHDSAEMSDTRIGAQKIAFLYPGQGSQRYGENWQLASASREFRHGVETLEQRFSPIDVGRFLSRAWADMGTPRPVDEEITTTEVAQAMLTVLGVSTSDALAQLGVVPGFALGHSVGEFGAAYASGLVDEIEVCRYVAARIRCVKDCMPAGEFGMLAIGLSLEEAESRLQIPDAVSLSSDNSTCQVVYAGPMAAIRELAAQSERLDIRTALLKTQSAFHTTYQDAADQAFREFLKDQPVTNHRSSGATLISSVSGQPVADADECEALLGRQISKPVLFRSALTTLGQQEPAVLVQLYGGHSLINMYKAVNQTFAGVEIAFGGAVKEQSRQLSDNLCKLFLAVERFDASPILARRGIAALGHKQAAMNESVHRHNTKKEDIDVAEESMNHDVAASPAQAAEPAYPARERSGGSRDLQPPAVAVAVAVAETSSYSQGLLELFTSQVALLRDSGAGVRQSASRAPRSMNAAAGLPSGASGSASVTPDVVAVPADVTSSSADVEAHERGEIADLVIQTIAAQAGYSAGDVGLSDSLGEGLGLDSLIVADTARRLHRKYEKWVPQTMDFASITTVNDLVESIASAYDAPGTAVSTSGTARIEAPAAEVEPASAPVLAPAPETVVREPFLDSFPEVLAMQDRITKMSEGDASNPYYLEVDGTIGSHCSIGGRQLASFSSYNYLGLTTHPRVVNAAKAAIETYGTSVSAARILSGNRPIHADLERAISGLLQVEDAVVMVGGHSTNMGIIPHLLDQRDIIFHDSLVHDSILRGIQASGAARHSFTHNQADELERALTKRRGQFRRAIIIAEGIYSMDGDLPPLAKLVELKERFGATLMIDEAHSIGVLGRHGGGVCEELGIDPKKIDILMGTLSKSFASCGGYLAGSRPFIENLRYSLSGYIFSAGLTPANTAAALESIRVMKDEPDRLIQLRQNAKYFLSRATELGFNCGTAVGVPVVPTIFADSRTTLAVANFMFDNGVSANPIIFPAVAETMARLRFFITAEHTPELIDETLSVLARAVRSAEKLAV